MGSWRGKQTKFQHNEFRIDVPVLCIDWEKEFQWEKLFIAALETLS